MCSFDISSLFTGIPLLKTINMGAGALYHSQFLTSPIPQNIFMELMMSVEFCFNNIMYKQLDCVAMGYLLEPSLANIFVRFSPGAQGAKSVSWLF